MTRTRRFSLRFFITAGALFLFGAAQAAGYRHKNPHYKRKPKDAVEAVMSSTQTLVSPIDRLEPGRWKPGVKLALELFAEEHGKDAEGYDPDHPPVAVLAFNDLAVEGDLGELVFERMVEKAEFKFDDAWWNLVPLAYGRQKTRAAYEQFISAPPAVWDSQPAYHQYWKYMVGGYQEACRKIDRKNCRMYLARLFKGYTNEQAAAYAKRIFDDEEINKQEVREIAVDDQDPAPVKVRRGLRDVPEIKDLCILLIKAGWSVWVVELEFQPVLAAYAQRYGIEPTRVLGIKQSVFREKFTGKLEEPVPFRAGKVEAVVSAIGRPPSLIVSSARDDYDLLDYGAGLRLILDRGDKPLRERAQSRRWLIQPSFAP